MTKVNIVLVPLVGFNEDSYWLQSGGSYRRISTKNVDGTLEITHRIHTITIDSLGVIIAAKSVVPLTGIESSLYANFTQDELDESLAEFKEFICRKTIIISK